MYGIPGLQQSTGAEFLEFLSLIGPNYELFGSRLPLLFYKLSHTVRNLSVFSICQKNLKHDTLDVVPDILGILFLIRQCTCS